MPPRAVWKIRRRSLRTHAPVPAPWQVTHIGLAVTVTFFHGTVAVLDPGAQTTMLGPKPPGGRCSTFSRSAHRSRGLLPPSR